MAKTLTFAVKDVSSAEPTAITVQSPACQRVIVYENYAPPAVGTHDFQYRAPAASDSPAPRTAGQTVTFQALPGQLFSQGQILGYLETLLEGAEFVQEEG